MNIESAGFGAWVIILVMVIVTLVTRWGGVYIMSFLPINHRIKGFIHGMSGSLLVTIIAPLAFTGDNAARLALLTTTVMILVFKRPLLSICLGLLAAALLRNL